MLDRSPAGSLLLPPHARQGMVQGELDINLQKGPTMESTQHWKKVEEQEQKEKQRKADLKQVCLRWLGNQGPDADPRALVQKARPMIDEIDRIIEQEGKERDEPAPAEQPAAAEQEQPRRGPGRPPKASVA